MISIIIFFILNLINVIMSTMRSVLTVKASPLTAAIINTLSYTFYSGIIKLVTGQTMAIVLITTALTNIIGVYVAKVFLNKKKKDKLWRITATIPKNNHFNFLKELNNNNISCGYNIRGKWATFDCYSEDQKQSIIIKKLCKKYDAKVFISESLSF